MKTVAFHTLGCKVNQYDSQAMLELFEQAGYQPGDFDQPCDVPHCGEGVLLRGGRTEGFRRLSLELAMLYASSEYRLSGHVRLV